MAKWTFSDFANVGGGQGGSLNHQITNFFGPKSPTFLGLNHHHQFSRCFRSKLAQIRGVNLHFDEILAHFCQQLKFYLWITKSPRFFRQNHQITTIFWGKSPSPHLLGITKSPTFFCPNHQITSQFWPKSPITKYPLVPPYITFPML